MTPWYSIFCEVNQREFHQHKILSLWKVRLPYFDKMNFTFYDIPIKVTKLFWGLIVISAVISLLNSFIWFSFNYLIFIFFIATSFPFHYPLNTSQLLPVPIYLSKVIWFMLIIQSSASKTYILIIYLNLILL